MTDYLEQLLDEAQVLTRAVKAAEGAAAPAMGRGGTAAMPDALAPAGEQMAEMEFLAEEVLRRSVTLPPAAERVTEEGGAPALWEEEHAPLPILRAVEQGERTAQISRVTEAAKGRSRPSPLFRPWPGSWTPRRWIWPFSGTAAGMTTDFLCFKEVMA